MSTAQYRFERSNYPQKELKIWEALVTSHYLLCNMAHQLQCKSDFCGSIFQTNSSPILIPAKVTWMERFFIKILFRSRSANISLYGLMLARSIQMSYSPSEQAARHPHRLHLHLPVPEIPGHSQSKSGAWSTHPSNICLTVREDGINSAKS
jgi:hypothetical protein